MAGAQRIEVGLGAIVGSDAGGHDDAGAAAACDQPERQLGEESIEVDVASAGERKAPALAYELARGLGGVAGVLELGVELLLGGALAVGQGLDHAAAGSGVAGLGDARGAHGEELLLLELD